MIHHIHKTDRKWTRIRRLFSIVNRSVTITTLTTVISNIICCHFRCSGKEITRPSFDSEKYKELQLKEIRGPYFSWSTADTGLWYNRLVCFSFKPVTHSWKFPSSIRSSITNTITCNIDISVSIIMTWFTASLFICSIVVVDFTAKIRVFCFD